MLRASVENTREHQKSVKDVFEGGGVAVE